MAQAYAPSPPAPTRWRLDGGLNGPPRLPGLADGVELIGRYEGSGYTDAPYLVKRRDGQVIQLTRLLYIVISNLRPGLDSEAVARRVSRDFGREVSGENVEYLVDNKLRSTGLLDTPEAQNVPLSTPNPLLALKLRFPLVPERAHRHVTNAFKHLFHTPLIVVAVLAMIALNAWLIADLGSGLILAAQLVIYQPQLLLPITALTVLMVGFHEIGHASAARYGGAHPGSMGVGIYLVWPVFYTDVTDAYRLDRKGRLRVDLGGLYFNTLFTLAIGGLYLATDHLVFVVFIVVAQLETLRQLLPFVRLDGYYVVCDLAGVPNLFEYVKPALARLVRRTPVAVATHTARTAAVTRRFETLTRRARIVLTVWALITAPVLAVNIAVLLFSGPRLAGAAYGSVSRQIGVLVDAFSRVAFLDILTSLVGIVFLVLPSVGMLYLVTKLVGRVRTSVVRWWGERPIATALVVGALGMAVAYQVGFVWPETFAAAARPPQPEQLTTEAKHIPRDVPGGVSTVAEMPPVQPAATPVPATVNEPPPAPEPAPEPEPTPAAEAEEYEAPATTLPAPPTTLPVAPPPTAPPAAPAEPAPTPSTTATTAPGATTSTTTPGATTSTTLGLDLGPLTDLLLPRASQP